MAHVTVEDMILRAHPALPPDTVRRAVGIIFAHQGFELELRILTEQITLRTKLHVPVTTDDMARWRMRSHHILQRQALANDALYAVAGELNETAMVEPVDEFLQTMNDIGIGTFRAAASEFTAAITTAAAARRD